MNDAILHGGEIRASAKRSRYLIELESLSALAMPFGPGGASAGGARTAFRC